MTSWSFSGALYEYEFPTESKDLTPGSSSNLSDVNLRQEDLDRTSLYDFFSASDKAIDEANSNWALSADVTSSCVFLGNYFGVFFH